MAQMKKRNGGNREFVFSERERLMLKKIGLRINKDLFEQNRSAEQLAVECNLARSTVAEIIAGRSNVRILTLSAIAEALGYRSLAEFLISL